jgi:hypothetical protein
LRAEGAIRPAVVDASSLVHTAWDLGSPINTVTWYLQLVGAEIRVIDCDHDLDLTPVQRRVPDAIQGISLWQPLLAA